MTSLTKYQEKEQDMVVLNTMAEIAIKSGKYPGFDHATVMNVFLTASALDVHPMLALNSGFNVINGKLNMGAHFMVSLARREGHSIKVLEMSKEKCVMLGTRKDNRDSIKFEYTWEDACDAGLGHKQNWKTNRRQMLYCACARNLFRMLFCDIAIPYDADEMNAGATLEASQDGSLLEIHPREPAEMLEAVEAREIAPEADPMVVLKDMLHQDGVDTKQLQAFIADLAARKKKEAGAIVASAINTQFFPKFKSVYQGYLDQSAQPVQESAEASA